MMSIRILLLVVLVLGVYGGHYGGYKKSKYGYSSKSKVTNKFLPPYKTPIPARPCQETDEVCVYTFNIEPKLTMIKGGRSLVILHDDGLLYPPGSVGNLSTAIDPDTIEVGDGWYKPKMLITINGTVPGPAIVAWVGQEIIVNIVNKLITQTSTIHWHGLPVRGTPWFDGVPNVNVCPILPGHKAGFYHTQRFWAYPEGTHWYHGHKGFQMTEGLYGPIIIHPKVQHCPVDGEHVMLFANYNHNHQGEEWLMYLSGRVFGQLERAFDDTDNREWHSGLINGRGRFNYDNGTAYKPTPLSEFKVTAGKKYRFRLIGSQADTFYKISIDDHKFKVISSDGMDIVPVEAEYVVVAPGERYDFVLTANQPTGKYWIRAEAPRTGHLSTLAVLRYDTDNSIGDPTSSPWTCSPGSKCDVVNCAHGRHFLDNTTNCITWDQIKGAPWIPSVPLDHDATRIEDKHFNWHFGDRKVLINGHNFVFPESPTLTGNMRLTECDSVDCGPAKSCQCTYGFHVDYDNVIQMYWLSAGNGRSTHPIHLHGHHFHVLKVEYSDSIAPNGRATANHPHIECDEPTFCNSPRWKDSSWDANSIPGLNFDNPPLKDTLIVPAGGYAVVRFRADNPGAWLIHCHIDDHLALGMVMMIIEGEEQWKRLLKPPPGKYPSCTHYTPFKDINSKKHSLKRNKISYASYADDFSPIYEGYEHEY